MRERVTIRWYGLERAKETGCVGQCDVEREAERCSHSR